jgi:hypothetical protein
MQEDISRETKSTGNKVYVAQLLGLSFFNIKELGPRVQGFVVLKVCYL